MNHKAALAFLVAALSVPTALLASEPGGRRYGDTQVLSPIPSPGFPEGIVVEGTTAYVTGPATFGTAGQGPSQIFAIDTTSGRILSTIPLAGEDLTQEHALSCITSDGRGLLYALSTQLGVVRIDPATGAQQVYATIPHLPACIGGLPPGPCRVGEASCLPPGPCVSGRCLPPGPCVPSAGAACLPPGPCAPVAQDRGSLPNDLAFDDAGNLYVTDSFQATIFQIPAGGGVAEAYYQDARFDTSTIPGFSIGFNGIRVSPDRTKLIFTQTFGPNAGVWSLPLIPNPPPYTLQQVHAYTAGELPDGLAYGTSGRLYVALAGANAIGLLDAFGREFFRAPSADVNATLAVPFDNPANVAFNGRGSLLTVNHALFGNPADAAVLDTLVLDYASPLARPIVP